MANKTMKTLTIGEHTYEIVDEAARNGIELLNQSTVVDTTLKKTGFPADSAAVGNEANRLNNLINSEISSVNGEITKLDNKISSVNGEITKLDTSLKNEVSRLDGLIGNTTVSQQINSAISSKQNTITGAATTITGSNLTANRALVSDANGKVGVSAVTSTELGYLDGVTSSVQTQLNAKVQKLTATASLTVAGWSSSQQTVSVSGVTTSNTIIVTPNPASYVHYNECMVRCSAQASGKLTFTCTDTPTSALTVNVLILN